MTLAQGHGISAVLSCFTPPTPRTLPCCCIRAILTAGFFVVTLRKNGGLMTVFSTLVLTFLLLAGGQHNQQCATAAGYVGFLCGTSAIYTAFGELYHEELGITLPGIAPVRYI